MFHDCYKPHKSKILKVNMNLIIELSTLPLKSICLEDDSQGQNVYFPRIQITSLTIYHEKNLNKNKNTFS